VVLCLEVQALAVEPQLLHDLLQLLQLGNTPVSEQQERARERGERERERNREVCIP
jgi:hypothetical protein